MRKFFPFCSGNPNPKNTTREEALILEKKLFSFSGIAESRMVISDIEVGENEFIHTIQLNKPKNDDFNNCKTLLLLHGYGSGGVSYFRLLKEFADDYYVLVLDLPGMCVSTPLPDVPFDSTKTCIEYFISRIENLMNSLKIDFFSIIAHSLGAYIATHLFKKLKHRIPKLFLLSPAGVNHPSKNEAETYLDKLSNSNPIKRFFIRKILTHIFVTKQSPFEHYLIKLFLSKMIGLYSSSKRVNFNEDEQLLVKNIYQYVLRKPQLGERCLGHLLYYGFKSPLPLIDVFEELKDRHDSISIFYGEWDHIDHDVSTKNIQERNFNISILYIEDSDHLLPMQNVKMLADLIKQQLYQNGESGKTISIGENDNQSEVSLICEKTNQKKTSEIDEKYTGFRLARNAFRRTSLNMKSERKEYKNNDPNYEKIMEMRFRCRHNSLRLSDADLKAFTTMKKDHHETILDILE